jgi:tryptophanyl-tRNA synthetase
MHGLTQIHDPATLKTWSITILKLYKALGINTEKVYIYNPADIPGHAQLNRILSCITIMGTMERMHSYKDALTHGKAGEIGVGVFCYPILMAADILLYDADLVPVGKDQKQHVEYARDIAAKFNRTFGETFTLPEPFVPAEVATIIGLDGRKMSKSYNNYIGLLDDEKTLLKKVKQISTDMKTVEEPKNPDECNVYNIGKFFLTPAENETRRAKYLAGGYSYKEAKEYAFEKIRSYLQPIQKNYRAATDEEVISLLEKNKEKV